MNRIIKNAGGLLTVLIALSFLGCGGKSVVISPADIASAEKNGSLISLYQKAEKLMSDAKGSSKERAAIVVSQIGKKLAKQHAKMIHAELNERGQNSLVTRNDLIQAQAKAQPMQKWDPALFNITSEKLKLKIADVNSQIRTLLQQGKQNGLSTLEQVDLLKKASALAGNGQPENQQYKELVSKAKALFLSDGKMALAKRMFNIAEENAENGLSVDPGNIAFESMLSQAQLGLFEQAFRASLENGKPETAYNALKAIADKPILLLVKKKMQRNIAVLANYFAGNAKVKHSQKNWLAAYQDFMRGRDVQKMMDSSSIGFIQEKAFLDDLMKKSDEAVGKLGVQFSLLSIIKFMDPNYPELDAKFKSVNDAITSRAVTKVSVNSFSEVATSNSAVAAFGRRISSKLEKQLFDSLGNRLEIVTDISKVASDEYSGVSLVITGEVLQAAIETKTNQGKKSVNAQTGVSRVESDAYTKWKKRKRGDQPNQYNETPIMEDLVLTIEHIKKLAVAEVAYKIIDPVTQKVMHTDSFFKEESLSGDAINEFQKGSFHQPYVEAELPSDIKIMDGLASQLTASLADSLIGYLASPEKVYFESYRENLKKAENAIATEMLANSIVIAKSDDENNKSKAQLLSELVLENLDSL